MSNTRNEVVRIALTGTVNEVLGDHNVDKQTTDSRGDVSLVNMLQFVAMHRQPLTYALAGGLSHGRHQQRQPDRDQRTL